MKRMLATASAVALSFALLAAAPAFAQEQTADAVMTGMSELGIAVDGLVLTEEQVLQIQAMLSDAGMADEEKKMQIETLLAE